MPPCLLLLIPQCFLQARNNLKWGLQRRGNDISYPAFQKEVGAITVNGLMCVRATVKLQNTAVKHTYPVPTRGKKQYKTHKVQNQFKGKLQK